MIALGLPATYKVETLTKWNRDAHHRFERIEQRTFEKGLRYTYQEMCDRASRPGFQAMFVSDDSGASAVLVIYELDPQDQLYLDTLAVSSRGSGLGSLLLRRLIDWAHERYRVIVLDTEETNPFGQKLVQWYARFGFDVEDRSPDTGNVTMHLTLR